MSLCSQAPVVNKVKDGQNLFQFFHKQDGYHYWIDLPQLPPLSDSEILPETDMTKYAIVGVGSKLYAAGGLLENDRYRYARLCRSAFNVYLSEQNEWFRLQPMSQSRHSLALVHQDGFIYAIGGQSDVVGGLFGKRGTSDHPLLDLERYDIAQNCWVNLTPMPFACHEISAVAFKSKILVSGLQSPIYGWANKRLLMTYSLDTDKWDFITEDVGKTDLVPMLFVHNNRCYRVLHRYEGNHIGVPSVNELNFGTGDDSDEVILTTTCIDNVMVQDGVLGDFIIAPIIEEVTQKTETSVSIGEDIRQDFIPSDRGAFRIDDEVFMIKKGFVYKTDVRISPEQSTDVDLDAGKWGEFNRLKDEFYASNITYLTFDKKKLTKG